MEYIQQAEEIVEKILKIANAEGKITGFSIGNTAKISAHDLYFTPIRNTSLMIMAGVIVYSEEQAENIAKIVDGKVQYILVDSEKKIAPFELENTANVERIVRKTTQQSKLWFYKGNDLSVEAVDGLLAQLTSKLWGTIEGKKIAILGAGNLGAKLALKLVERGAQVVITRRNKQALEMITQAINYIKPTYTQASVIGMGDNREAAKDVQILIGAVQGTPVITEEMINGLANDAIIIDVGKGTLHFEAIEAAKKRGFEVYRLDVSAAFDGLIHKLWAIENTVEKKSGRRKLYGESLVSGGLLAGYQEIVVDNVWSPHRVYGIADGQGDFIRPLTSEQTIRIEKLQQFLKTNISHQETS